MADVQTLEQVKIMIGKEEKTILINQIQSENMIVFGVWLCNGLSDSAIKVEEANLDIHKKIAETTG